MTALPKILFVLLLACAGLPVASAANAPADDVAVKELANGLRVIVKPDRRAPVAVSMVWYRIGSVDEQGGITGVAHVLEHMMFKGTKAVPAGEFSRLIAAAPKLLQMARELAAFIGENTEDAPAELIAIGRTAKAILKSVSESPVAPTATKARAAAE